MIKIVLSIVGFIWVLYGGVVFMFALDWFERTNRHISMIKMILLMLLCAVAGLPMRIVLGLKKNLA